MTTARFRWRAIFSRDYTTAPTPPARAAQPDSMGSSVLVNRATGQYNAGQLHRLRPGGRPVSILIDCPSCETGHHLPDNASGRTVACRKCGDLFAVEGPGVPPPRLGR